MNAAERQFENRFMEGVALFADYADEKLEIESVRKFFDRLLADYPNSVGVLMFLGHIYREMGELERSVEFALKATQISPISEMSSFVLHNSLIESGYMREAYQEMRRFYNQSGAQPTAPLYENYLNELAEDLDIPWHMYPDKRDLLEEVIQELDQLGLLENRAT